MSAIGQNRHNDTPIGGLPEFRGNMQGGEVWNVDNVPAWDGEKFAPATNSALLNAYGGLYEPAGAVIAADGTNIDGWDTITPVGGVPKQVIVDALLGTIQILQAGDYGVSFALNCGALTNSQDYDFLVAIDGIASVLGSRITGSNQVDAQSTGFDITFSASGGGILSIQASGGTTFTVGSMSFGIKRIG
jgi:hypothetical protein